MKKNLLFIFCSFIMLNANASVKEVNLINDHVITFKNKSIDSEDLFSRQSSILDIYYTMEINRFSQANIEEQTTTTNFADCIQPEFGAVKNCNPDGQYFTVDIQVDDLGSATTVEVSDDQNSATQELSNPGIVTFGPYPYDVDIVITVSDVDNPSCKTNQIVNSDSCPPIVCAEADPFCSDEGLFFPNSWDGDENGRNSAPEGIDYGCLYTTPNPAWFFLQIGQSGDLTLHISQNTAYDDDGNPVGTGLDVDFIAWGPFDSLEEACSNLTIENQVPRAWPSGDTGLNSMGYGCSYSSDVEEDFGVEDAQEGDIYVLLITNYDGAEGFIQVTQSAGDGSTNCSIVNQNEYLACEGDEVLLETSNPGQIAYLWNVYNPETDQFDIIEGETDTSLTVTEGGVYKLESYANDGELTEEIFTVIFSPNPELGNLEEETSLCGVESLTLDGTVTNMGDFGTVDHHWYDSDGNEISTDPTIDVTEPGTYTVQVSGTIFDSEGYESDQVCTTTIDVEVTNADFTINLGEDQVLCGQDSYEITAEITGSDPAEAIFTWTGPDGDIDSDSQTITVTESGLYTVNVNIGGCTGSDSVNIEFNAQPEFDLGDDIITCSLEGIILDATPSNTDVENTVFEWNYEGNAIEETGPTVNPNDYGFGTYTVTVYQDNPDCASTDSISIQEVDDFGLELNADHDLSASRKFCENDDEIPSYDITFTASLSNAETTDVIFTWYKNDQEITGENGNSYTVVFDAEGDYTDEYSVEATLGSCIATASLTTDVTIATYDHPCKITEGISPGNNDGYNDYFDLTFLNDRSGIAKFEVYNRYGVKVYEENNYIDSWRGQDDHGDDLTTGTYYYIIEMKNEDPVFGKTKRGWVYVNQKVN